MTKTQTPGHEFLASGCRRQWAADHDEAACWRAFESLTERTATMIGDTVEGRRVIRADDDRPTPQVGTIVCTLGDDIAQVSWGYWSGTDRAVITTEYLDELAPAPRRALL